MLCDLHKQSMNKNQVSQQTPVFKRIILRTGWGKTHRSKLGQTRTDEGWNDIPTILTPNTIILEWHSRKKPVGVQWGGDSTGELCKDWAYTCKSINLEWTHMSSGVRKNCCSVVKLCLTLCDPMDCSTRGFPVLHYLPEFAQVHVHGLNGGLEIKALLSEWEISCHLDRCLVTFPTVFSIPNPKWLSLFSILITVNIWITLLAMMWSLCYFRV